MAPDRVPAVESTESVEVVVARIGKPHGIRGEVTVDVRTDEPETRFADGTVLRAEAPRGSDGVPANLTVSRSRWHQQRLLLTFDEIGDRTAAESLRGVTLHTTLAAGLRPEDPEEYYDHHLIGLQVIDPDGQTLGEVSAVVHGAAQDLLTVRTPDGRDALVPFVAALVPEVDLDGGTVTVADRPGLVSPFPDEG